MRSEGLRLAALRFKKSRNVVKLDLEIEKELTKIILTREDYKTLRIEDKEIEPDNNRNNLACLEL